MNAVFLVMVMVSFLVAVFRQATWKPTAAEAVPPMEAVSTAVVQSAGSAVTLAIGLIGVMALFLGVMKVAEAGGLLKIIAKTVRPLAVHVFPDVPAEHPAMGAMILNFSANALGLGNAATPFGIRAVQELDKLNPHKGTATNAMALFLAINSSSLALLPTGVIALRASAGSVNPAGILPTTLFATAVSTTVAIIAAKLYERLAPLQPSPSLLESTAPPTSPDIQRASADAPAEMDAVAREAEAKGYPGWVSTLALVVFLAGIPLAILYGGTIAPWIVPSLIVLLLGFGAVRRVRVYEVLVEGARDGFDVALKIIPYLVAILVAVAMLRASGALGMMVDLLGPMTSRVGLPAEALPMALIRPLSGSGAFGVLAATIQDPAIGPDSYTGYLVSTFQGSFDTTFYILAVYFGAVRIRRVRHALAASLTGDVAGIGAAVIACLYLYGN